MSQLQARYLADIRPKLKEEFGLTNFLAVPKISKIVINMGIGEGKDNQGVLEKAGQAFSQLAGQKAVVTHARKSISTFKLTKGAPIGLMVTLRGEKMYAFFEKLVSMVLPKVRDFKGVSENSFDSTGNFNLGLREQTLFPEVDYKNIDKIRGLQITINTTAKNRQQAKKLLELLGMPFKKES